MLVKLVKRLKLTKDLFIFVYQLKKRNKNRILNFGKQQSWNPKYFTS